jgi:adenylate cyclase
MHHHHSTANGAWIEWQEGGRVPLAQSCSIGRSSGNQVVLDGEQVSRRHAAINEEAPGEFQILDLGSSNGTFLNGRRLTQSTPLKHGDVIDIGPYRIVFHQPSAARRGPLPANAVEKTVCLITGGERWLMLADLEASTALSRRLKPEELPAVMGAWVDRCRVVIERHGGVIENQLGDGFLAYWAAAPAAADQVAIALAELKAMGDAGSDLPFRLVVHYGQVFTGGTTASGLEKFFGPEINFVFKSERLASALGRRGLMTAAAHARLAGKLDTSPLGPHEVAGFPGTYEFFGF